ncbi:acyl-lipid (9-3)-desaturase-like [Typha latifolia]|uniref:acyl-lipid (9-3)-desaturase-like n=1 Tax=Typha latifolia TaxID=4733 RepID=UPI003C2BA02D
MGLFEKKGYVPILCLFSMLLMLSVAVYYFITLESTIVHLCSTTLMGLIGVDSHNLGHYKITASRGLNRVVQVVERNILGFNPDVRLAPLTTAFYERNMPFYRLNHAALVCYQYWLLVPSCASLMPTSSPSHSCCSSLRWRACQELLGVAVFWFCLASWGEYTIFVLANCTITRTQHVQFDQNHFSTCVYVVPLAIHGWIIPR